VSIVIWLEDCASVDRGLVGGKAAGLGALHAGGLPVPPGFAVTTDAYRHSLGDEALARITQLTGGVGDLAQRSAAARDVVLGRELEPAHVDEVRSAYAGLCDRTGADRVPVAVRSSAPAEDTATASFAGEYDTYLWRRGDREVVDAVRHCWASLFGERALSYREHEGIETELAMAVVVQQMVPARSAGVLFTLNPENGDRSKIAVESTWGLGEPLVAGDVTPDGFLLDKVTGEVLRRRLGPKEIELVFDDASGSGVVTRSVPAERRAEASVTDGELEELRRLARTAERNFGAPVDIEWAVDESGRVFVLQVRAETVWSRQSRGPVAAPGERAVDLVIANLWRGAQQ
jgi:pyruvate,water dikinase